MPYIKYYKHFETVLQKRQHEIPALNLLERRIFHTLGTLPPKGGGAFWSPPKLWGTVVIMKQLIYPLLVLCSRAKALDAALELNLKVSCCSLRTSNFFDAEGFVLPKPY